MPFHDSELLSLAGWSLVAGAVHLQSMLQILLPLLDLRLRHANMHQYAAAAM